MADESTGNEISTGEETLQKAPEPEVKPEAKAEETSQPQPSEAPKKEWYYQRIDALTKQLRETQARAQELERNLSQPPQGQSQVPMQEVERLANERAFQIAQMSMAQQSFTNQCNAIAEQIDKEFGEDARNSAVVSVNSVCGGLPPQLIDALSETQNPGRVFHHLGTNPAVLMEVMSMPPVRMAAKIASLGQSLSGKTQNKMTKAPEPISPQIGVANGGFRALDDISNVDEWMAERNKQVAERRKNAR